MEGGEQLVPPVQKIAASGEQLAGEAGLAQAAAAESAEAIESQGGVSVAESAGATALTVATAATAVGAVAAASPEPLPAPTSAVATPAATAFGAVAAASSEPLPAPTSAAATPAMALASEVQAAGESSGAAVATESVGRPRRSRLREREMLDGDDDGSSSSEEEKNKGNHNHEHAEHNMEEVAVERSPLGRFVRFNRKLGAGSYKSVYLGFDCDTGKEVAWNIISLQDVDKRAKKRITEEINMLKSLAHPRIIAFINAWINKKDNQVCFITERVTGGSLLSYIRRIGAPLKLKVMRTWCRQILEGLHYLHSRPDPIIHRDLKCDNIFINGNVGEVLIGDLGLSTTLKQSCAKSIVGTPDFIAPEVYDENYGTAVDIYAFGMCLLEMVARGSPYGECATAGQVYKKVVAGEKPRVLRRIKDEQLRLIIDQCIQKNPLKRPTAHELLDHIWLQENEVDGNQLCELIKEEDLPLEHKAPPDPDMAPIAEEGDPSQAEASDMGDRNLEASEVEPGTVPQSREPLAPPAPQQTLLSSPNIDSPHMDAPLETSHRAADNPATQVESSTAPTSPQPTSPSTAASGQADDASAREQQAAVALPAEVAQRSGVETGSVASAIEAVAGEAPTNPEPGQSNVTAQVALVDAPAAEHDITMGSAARKDTEMLPAAANVGTLVNSQGTSASAEAVHSPLEQASCERTALAGVNVATPEPSREPCAHPEDIGGTTPLEDNASVASSSVALGETASEHARKMCPSPKMNISLSPHSAADVEELRLDYICSGSNHNGRVNEEVFSEALESINHALVSQVNMSIEMEGAKFNVDFDFDPKTDSAQMVAQELKDARIAPETIPLEDLIRDIELAIIARCHKMTGKNPGTDVEAAAGLTTVTPTVSPVETTPAMSPRGPATTAVPPSTVSAASSCSAMGQSAANGAVATKAASATPAAVTAGAAAQPSGTAAKAGEGASSQLPSHPSDSSVAPTRSEDIPPEPADGVGTCWASFGWAEAKKPRLSPEIVKSSSASGEDVALKEQITLLQRSLAYLIPSVQEAEFQQVGEWCDRTSEAVASFQTYHRLAAEQCLVDAKFWDLLSEQVKAKDMKEINKKAQREEERKKLQQAKEERRKEQDLESKLKFESMMGNCFQKLDEGKPGKSSSAAGGGTMPSVSSSTTAAPRSGQPATEQGGSITPPSAQPTQTPAQPLELQSASQAPDRPSTFPSTSAPQTPRQQATQHSEVMQQSGGQQQAAGQQPGGQFSQHVAQQPQPQQQVQQQSQQPVQSQSQHHIQPETQPQMHSQSQQQIQQQSQQQMQMQPQSQLQLQPQPQQTSTQSQQQTQPQSQQSQQQMQPQGQQQISSQVQTQMQQQSQPQIQQQSQQQIHSQIQPQSQHQGEPQSQQQMQPQSQQQLLLQQPQQQMHLQSQHQIQQQPQLHAQPQSQQQVQPQSQQQMQPHSQPQTQQPSQQQVQQTHSQQQMQPQPQQTSAPLTPRQQAPQQAGVVQQQLGGQQQQMAGQQSGGQQMAQQPAQQPQSQQQQVQQQPQQQVQPQAQQHVQPESQPQMQPQSQQHMQQQSQQMHAQSQQQMQAQAQQQLQSQQPHQQIQPQAQPQMQQPSQQQIHQQPQQQQPMQPQPPQQFQPQPQHQQQILPQLQQQLQPQSQHQMQPQAQQNQPQSQQQLLQQNQPQPSQQTQPQHSQTSQQTQPLQLAQPLQQAQQQQLQQQSHQQQLQSQPSPQPQPCQQTQPPQPPQQQQQQPQWQPELQMQTQQQQFYQQPASSQNIPTGISTQPATSSAYATQAGQQGQQNQMPQQGPSAQGQQSQQPQQQPVSQQAQQSQQGHLYEFQPVIQQGQQGPLQGQQGQQIEQQGQEAQRGRLEFRSPDHSRPSSESVSRQPQQPSVSVAVGINAQGLPPSVASAPTLPAASCAASPADAVHHSGFAETPTGYSGGGSAQMDFSLPVPMSQSAPDLMWMSQVPSPQQPATQQQS